MIDFFRGVTLWRNSVTLHRKFVEHRVEHCDHENSLKRSNSVIVSRIIK